MTELLAGGSESTGSSDKTWVAVWYRHCSERRNIVVLPRLTWVNASMSDEWQCAECGERFGLRLNRDSVEAFHQDTGLVDTSEQWSSSDS